MNNNFLEIEKALPTNILQGISKYMNFSQLEEIRLRVNKPVILNGEKCSEIIIKEIIINEKIIKDIFNILTGYSAYAYEDSIREGYLTLKGGHRIGFGGEIKREDNKIITFGNIAYINIRICHEIINCGIDLINKISYKKKLLNTLIISPPGLGKTTLLRDLVRLLSDNLSGTSISVIDERCEISGSYRGVSQIDLGIRTDIISNCNKSKGILMAVRSLAPKIIATDEIGGKQDMEALNYAIKSGVKIMATIHGSSVEKIRDKLGKDFFNEIEKFIIIKEMGVYECF